MKLTEQKGRITTWKLVAAQAWPEKENRGKATATGSLNVQDVPALAGRYST